MRVAWCLLLLACSGRKVPTTNFDTALAAADAAWQPLEPGFVPRVRVHLDRAARYAADDPELLWRRARLLVAVGLGAADREEAITAFGEARQIAASCLDADVAFARRRRASGWKAGLDLVPRARRACADQLAWAWTRWWLEVGPSEASIDGGTLEILTSRRDSSEVIWARALVAGARGEDGWAILEPQSSSLSSDPAWMADASFLAVRAGRPDVAKDWKVSLERAEPSGRQRASVARLARWVEP